MQIPVDPEKLSIVYHIGIHVDFSSMMIYLDPKAWGVLSCE